MFGKKTDAAEITEEIFGTINGENIKKYDIKSGDIEFSVMEYGATLLSLKFRGVEVTLGYDTLQEYVSVGEKFGATIGRVSNRISGGRFFLNGETYDLCRNDGNNTLDGGKKGFSGVKWQTVGKGDGSVTFAYRSADGEEGFPGELKAKVTYSAAGNGLRIEYSAESDKDTPVNLTNNVYFNLSGCVNSVELHTLTVNAERFAPIDKNLLPTGEIVSVEDTPFDFRMTKRLADGLAETVSQLRYAGGYAHNFVLDGTGFREAARVYAPETGIIMVCKTDMPCIELYSGNYLPKTNIAGGKSIKRRYGLCLKPQNYPDFLNRPEFPSVILKAGEKYKSVTEYAFGSLKR